jgi:hypothetical protein
LSIRNIPNQQSYLTVGEWIFAPDHIGSFPEIRR